MYSAVTRRYHTFAILFEVRCTLASYLKFERKKKKKMNQNKLHASNEPCLACFVSMEYFLRKPSPTRITPSFICCLPRDCRLGVHLSRYLSKQYAANYCSVLPSERCGYVPELSRAARGNVFSTNAKNKTKRSTSRISFRSAEFITSPTR